MQAALPSGSSLPTQKGASLSGSEVHAQVPDSLMASGKVASMKHSLFFPNPTAGESCYLWECLPNIKYARSFITLP